jgi:hypothetical protein
MNKKQFQTLKETIDKLEGKVNAAKEQLQIPINTTNINGKTFIHYEYAIE